MQDRLDKGLDLLLGIKRELSRIADSLEIVDKEFDEVRTISDIALNIEKEVECIYLEMQVTDLSDKGN